MPSTFTVTTAPPQRPVTENYRFEALDASLSTGEMEKLRRYAKSKMWGIKATVSDSDADDLVHEAIQRTIDGRRVWNRELHDLLTHLKQSVSSIASDWSEKGDRTRALIYDVEDPRPRRQNEELEASQKVERLRKALRGESVAAMVLESVFEGYSRAEAIKGLCITPGDYDAARKKITRLAMRTISSEQGK